MKQAQILPLMKFLENEAFVQAKTPHGFINYHCICKTVKVNELWGFLNKCYFDSLCQKGCTIRKSGLARRMRQISKNIVKAIHILRQLY